jgi:hypothetical protein
VYFKWKDYHQQYSNSLEWFCALPSKVKAPLRQLGGDWYTVYTTCATREIASPQPHKKSNHPINLVIGRFWIGNSPLNLLFDQIYRQLRNIKKWHGSAVGFKCVHMFSAVDICFNNNNYEKSCINLFFNMVRKWKCVFCIIYYNVANLDQHHYWYCL